MTDRDTFYTDHWRDIEPERIARYEELFRFHAEQQPIVDALELAGAGRVLDFGCGPGYMAQAFASQSSAEVIGADLNADFIRRASEQLAADNLAFVHLDQSQPRSLGRFDRIFCKNVLEYVPDIDATIGFFHDSLNPGGKVLILDSDWQFVLVEPWGSEQTRRFFEAASPAFREPEAGRRLPGALARAGFTDIGVRVSAGVDRDGRSIDVVRNMVSYINTFGTMPEAEVSAMMAELEAALDTGEFMFILPQFVISARAGRQSTR